MTILTGSAIDIYRLHVLEKALKLEVLGMTRRGRTTYSIIKEEFGIKGSKQKVHEQFKQLIKDIESGKVVYQGRAGRGDK